MSPEMPPEVLAGLDAPAPLPAGTEPRPGTERAGNRAALRHPLKLALGLRTARLRALPDFVVAGSQRCGTTSLYKYLSKHPSVMPAVIKEVHFFDRDGNFGRGLLWYRGHFPTQAALAWTKWRTGLAVAGEATPRYIEPHSSTRMATTLPRAQVIVLLRDPVERAYSAYKLRCSKREMRKTFVELVDEALEAFDEGECRRTGRYGGLLGPGLYAEQLPTLQRSYSPEQLLVLRAEDMFAEPARVYGVVLDFLGLWPLMLGQYRVYNQQPGPPMDPTARRRLTEFYRPYNERLYAHLGRDLGWSR